MRMHEVIRSRALVLVAAVVCLSPILASANENPRGVALLLEGPSFWSRIAQSAPAGGRVNLAGAYAGSSQLANANGVLVVIGLLDARGKQAPNEGEGLVEGEGPVEGEGTLDGEGQADGEGVAEGYVEGVSEGEGEGSAEGEEEAEGEITLEGEVEDGVQTSDQNSDFLIDLSELLRLVQLYNAGAFRCADNPEDTEDGYLPGSGANQSCRPYDTDYSPQDWVINLSELLRMIQFYNVGGYNYCPAERTEDGFCPGP